MRGFKSVKMDIFSGNQNENQVWKAQIERLELQRDQAKEKGVLEKKRADDLEEKLALVRSFNLGSPKVCSIDGMIF